MMGPAAWLVVKSGVSTQLSKEEPRAVYTHCYGHALNLTVSDMMKKNRLMSDTLNTTTEISKLLKFSPCHDVLKSELAKNVPGFRTICPTHWDCHKGIPSKCC